MTATKDDVTKYTKPELIKALRAAWAREARLQKQVEKLKGLVEELEADAPLGPVNPPMQLVTQDQAEAAAARILSATADRKPNADFDKRGTPDAKPGPYDFPWEQK